MATKTAPRGVAASLQSAATTGNGDTVLIPSDFSNTRVEFTGAGTISGGSVSLEESSDPTYSGTWSNIYTLDPTTLTGGAKQVVHIVGTMGAIRARITSNITGGGTISASVYGG